MNNTAQSHEFFQRVMRRHKRLTRKPTFLSVWISCAVMVVVGMGLCLVSFPVWVAWAGMLAVGLFALWVLIRLILLLTQSFPLQLRSHLRDLKTCKEQGLIGEEAWLRLTKEVHPDGYFGKTYH